MERHPSDKLIEDYADRRKKKLKKKLKKKERKEKLLFSSPTSPNYSSSQKSSNVSEKLKQGDDTETKKNGMFGNGGSTSEEEFEFDVSFAPPPTSNNTSTLSAALAVDKPAPTSSERHGLGPDGGSPADVDAINKDKFAVKITSGLLKRKKEEEDSIDNPGSPLSETIGDVAADSRNFSGPLKRSDCSVNNCDDNAGHSKSSTVPIGQKRPRREIAADGIDASKNQTVVEIIPKERREDCNAKDTLADSPISMKKSTMATPEEQSKSTSGRLAASEEKGKCKDSVNHKSDITPDDGEATLFENGPRYHVNERVLCIDAEQNTNSGGDSNDHSTSANGTDNKETCPLYQAIVRKSGLRYVDPITGKVLPDRVMKNQKFHIPAYQTAANTSTIPTSATSSNNSSATAAGGMTSAGIQKREKGSDTLQSQEKDEKPQSQSQFSKPPQNEQMRQWCHLIHFQGWNSRWDRWMTESDIFPDDDHHRKRLASRKSKKQTKVKEDAKRKKKRTTQKEVQSKSKTEEEANVVVGSERENEPVYQNLKQIMSACSLPFTLQTVLIDDKERITKRIYPPPRPFYDGSSLGEFDNIRDKCWTLLHDLPAAITIKTVMGRFLADKRQSDEEAVTKQKQHRKPPAKNVTKSTFSSSRGTVVVSPTDLTLSSKKSKNNVKKQLNSSTSIVSHRATALSLMNSKHQNRKEFSSAILELMDVAIPLFFLYKEERQQFLKVCCHYDDRDADSAESLEDEVGTSDIDEDDDKDNQQQKQHLQDIRREPLKPSEVYGAEHLLRLFIRLPYLLSRFGNLVPSHLQDFNTSPPPTTSKSPSFPASLGTTSENSPASPTPEMVARPTAAASSQQSAQSLSAPVSCIRSSHPGVADEAANSKASGDSIRILFSKKLSNELAGFLTELVVFLQQNRTKLFKARYYAVME